MQRSAFVCCSGVLLLSRGVNASAKMTFDGSIERINCFAQHEDYLALTNRTVLLQVVPLLKDKDDALTAVDLVYQKRSEYNWSDLELKRSIMYYSFYFGLMTDYPCRFICAVAYRWIVRWHRGIWDGKIRDLYWHIFMRTWGSVIRLHMPNQEDTNILNAWSNYLHIIFWVKVVSDISINWLCSLKNQIILYLRPVKID